ncbi:acyl-CoA dehydrogenase family protein (plasmid) [Rhodococcoides fascians]|uniref:acyl-CoA dehydrogenase family protein n=1 Tax=Rhodococcoides fascians TaxID=1828 RepID=UPI00389B1914
MTAASDAVNQNRFIIALRAAASIRTELTRDDVARAVAELKAAGLGALTVPESHGGGGADLSVLFDFLVELATVDPNISHAVGNHYHFVDGLRFHDDRDLADRAYASVVHGHLYTVCAAEAASASSVTTISRAADGSFELNGIKAYSTGSTFADVFAVRATTPNGEPRTVLVEATSPHVEVRDDWAAFGQQHTGSGTVTFDHIRVDAGSVVDFGESPHGSLPYRGGFTQLVLLASAAGITQRVHSDAIAMVGRRTRNFAHGSAEDPRHDPFIQSVVGELSALAWITRLAVKEAAATFADRPDPRDGIDAYIAASQAASVEISRAKSIVDRLSLQAATRLFDAGGGTAVAEDRALDRHWRNLRTLASHNPKEYRDRAVGDLEINGSNLPASGPF